MKKKNAVIFSMKNCFHYLILPKSFRRNKNISNLSQSKINFFYTFKSASVIMALLKIKCKNGFKNSKKNINYLNLVRAKLQCQSQR